MKKLKKPSLGESIVADVLVAIASVSLIGTVAAATERSVTAEESAAQAQAHGFTLTGGQPTMRFGEDTGVQVDISDVSASFCTGVYYAAGTRAAQLQIWSTRNYQKVPFTSIPDPSPARLKGDSAVQAYCGE